ncbi:MAG TPA: hypothetical protein VIF44_02515 [Candidatus Limnocylindrales bacterium]
MPDRSVLESLAYVNWTLLFSLAMGSIAMIVALRRRTDPTTGYLGFVAACATVAAGLTALLDGGLPLPVRLAVAAPSPDLDQARRIGLIAFTALLALETVALRRGHGHRLGIVAIAAGLATIAFAALGWESTTLPGWVIGVQLLLLSAVTGGVLAAMILGHWYLVTPRLGEEHLILAVQLLLAALVVQLMVFIGSVAVSVVAQAPFGALSGHQTLLVWLVLGVGIVFPIVLTSMALRTAQTRSMESATGLLYIDTAAVVAGTIVSAALLFGAGIVV